MHPILKAFRTIRKASLYMSTVAELRELAAKYGAKPKARARKREIVDMLRASPSFADERSRAARQLKEARGLMRDLNMEVVSPNMVGALRGTLQDYARIAPDAGTRRQAMRAEDKVGRHIFADLDAWKAKEQLLAAASVKDRRLLPKDSARRTVRAMIADASPPKTERKRSVMGETSAFAARRPSRAM